MNASTLKWLQVAMAATAAAFAISCSTPASASERHFAEAAAQYHAARYSDAYGRFIQLADAGHVESARIVLFMHRHGALLYASHWDLSTEQLADYRQLARTRTAAAPPPVTQPAARAAAAAARALPRTRASGAPPGRPPTSLP